MRYSYPTRASGIIVNYLNVVLILHVHLLCSFHITEISTVILCENMADPLRAVIPCCPFRVLKNVDNLHPLPPSFKRIQALIHH